MGKFASFILLMFAVTAGATPIAGNAACCSRPLPAREISENSEQAVISTFMQEYPALVNNPPNRGHAHPPYFVRDPPVREIHMTLGAASLGTDFLRITMRWDPADPTVFQVLVVQLLGEAANSRGMISAVTAHERSFAWHNRSVRSIVVEWQLMRVCASMNIALALNANRIGGRPAGPRYTPPCPGFL